MIRQLCLLVCPLILVSQFTGSAAHVSAQDTLPEIELQWPLPAIIFDFQNLGVSVRNTKAPAIMTDVYGTAFDPEGLQTIRVQFHRVSDELFWNGSTWQDEERWVSAEIDGDNWLVPDVDLSMVDSYSIRLAIIDQAGNFAAPRDTIIYRVDTIISECKPTGALRSPLANRIIGGSSPAEPGGTIFQGSHPLQFSANDCSGFEIMSVFTQVINLESREYWNGLTWQSTPAWVPTESDSFPARYNTLVPVEFSEPGRYHVRMHISDRAGNVSTSADNAKYELLVLEDDLAPVARMQTPTFEFAILPNGALRGVGSTIAPGILRVAGSATDVGVGVSDVRVQIRNPDLNYWNGSAWQATPAWVSTLVIRGDDPNAVGWRVNFVDMTLPGDYTVVLASYDFLGNFSSAQGNWRSFIHVE